MLSDGAALYMDQVAGSSALQPHNWVGQRIPLHATSNGKVLLCELDKAEVERQVPRLPAYTGNTITSQRALQRELAEARKRGFAIAVDELEIGLTAVAAPVHNIHGEVVASLSVSGPTFRIGNTNSRIRFSRDPATFFDDWCAHGPTHHVALGIGHHVGRLRKVADLLGLELTVVA